MSTRLLPLAVLPALAVWPVLAVAAGHESEPLATKPVSATSNAMRIAGQRISIAGVLDGNRLTARLARGGVTVARATERERPRRRGDGRHPVTKLFIKLKKTSAHGGTATLRMHGATDPPASGGTGHDDYDVWTGVRWRVGTHSTIRFDLSVVPLP